MRARLPLAVAAALVAVLLVGCAIQVTESAPATSPDHSCPPSGPPPPEGCWQAILPSGSGGYPVDPGSENRPLWEPGRFPLTLTPHIAYDDQLWMTAQTRAYSSPDGLTWTEHAKTDWGERIYESIIYFKGRLWMYGGLDYQTRTFLNDIWSSPDGRTWSKIGNAAWPARGGHTVVVYHDRLWLFGGANHIAADRSPNGFVNDVWVSDDGISWTRVTRTAPWSPRDKAGAVVFDDELYLLGGQGTADVWRSSNGRDWTQLLASAAWGPRHDFARIAYDGRLWLFGGWEDRSTNALNDVWYSRDGMSWSRQTDHAPWAPRSPISVAFHDRIWIYSGKHTGADDNWGGDLWQMTTGETTAR
jgi:hypothetical protein